MDCGNKMKERRGLGTRRVSLVMSFLLILFLVLFILEAMLAGGLGIPPEPPQKIQGILFFLISLALFFNIGLQLRRALGEWIQREEEPAAQLYASQREYRYHWKGPGQTLLLHCLETLETHFRRFHAFHRYHHPHMLYYFLAKRGSISLFALPWAKTGFLLLFLVYSFHVSRGVLCSPKEYGLILVAMAICFWIPGMMLYFLVPYQKLWLCIVEERGGIHLTLACASPFPLSRLDSLVSSVKPTFNRIFREVLPEKGTAHQETRERTLK